MIPCCLDMAAGDPNVRGCLPVYIRLFSHLDFVEPRPAKLVVLSRELGLTEARVSQTLRTLVRRGYVVAGKRHGTGNTYRLLVSPGDPTRAK